MHFKLLISFIKLCRVTKFHNTAKHIGKNNKSIKFDVTLKNVFISMNQSMRYSYLIIYRFLLLSKISNKYMINIIF